MTQDTRFVHLTAASKQQFSCQCARTDWNMCVLSLSATFLLPREWVRPQQKSCRCARSRIKQCSPFAQLNSCATKVASARLASEHWAVTKPDVQYPVHKVMLPVPTLDQVHPVHLNITLLDTRLPSLMVQRNKTVSHACYKFQPRYSRLDDNLNEENNIQRFSLTYFRCTVPAIGEWMSKEHWRNDPGAGGTCPSAAVPTTNPTTTGLGTETRPRTHSSAARRLYVTCSNLWLI